MHQKPTLLKNDSVADMIGIKHGTLPIWRMHGKGPIFIKSGRNVLYDLVDVLDWLQQQKRTSTICR